MCTCVCTNVFICQFGLAFCQLRPLTDRIFHLFIPCTFHYYFIRSYWEKNKTKTKDKKSRGNFPYVCNAWCLSLSSTQFAAVWVHAANRTEPETIHSSLLNIDIRWILYTLLPGSALERNEKEATTTADGGGGGGGGMYVRAYNAMSNGIYGGRSRRWYEVCITLLKLFSVRWYWFPNAISFGTLSWTAEGESKRVRYDSGETREHNQF